jgi:AcrR family transcriptional regulator
MNMSSTPRSSAREALAAMTHDKIMEGLAGLLRKGDEEVTFDLVARESGVPVRTIYRYFENKEMLFRAFWCWMNEAIKMPASPTNAEEVVSHIPSLFAAFDRDEALVRAMIHNPYGRSVRVANAEARRAKFAVALNELLGLLTEKDARGLLASVTVLCSASGWESMKDNWQLSGGAAAEAAQWAVTALIDDARKRVRMPDRAVEERFDVITGDHS